MPAAPLPTPEIAESAPARKRFTRCEVDRMLATGAFEGQRLELIDGDLFNKVGQNPPHAFAIQLLAEWLSSFLSMGVVRVQLPMQASGPDSERSAPEPDTAVLKARTDLRRRHPRGNEMALVIEVADTTTAFDLKRKSEIYATAGVPEYWVLDLTRRMLVVHCETDGSQYRQIPLHAEEEFVSPAGRAERLQVGDILPEA